MKQLCNEAVAARTKQDVERAIGQLRAALDEHIRLARNSLGAQASTIGSLELRSQLQSRRRKKGPAQYR